MSLSLHDHTQVTSSSRSTTIETTLFIEREHLDHTQVNRRTDNTL